MNNDYSSAATPSPASASAPLPPTPPAPAGPPSAEKARVEPNNWHAFGGIWRLTSRRFLSLRHGLVLGGLLAGLALIAGISGETGDRASYLRWISQTYLTFLVPILAFVSGAGALRDELKPGSADYVFLRPVRRPLYLVGKYLAHLLCLEAGYLLALGVLFAVGWFRHVPDLTPALPRLLLAQALALPAFVALGFLFATLTSRYLIVGLVYGAVIEAGLGRIPTQLNRLSMTEQLRTLLHPFLPPGNFLAEVTAATPGTIVLLLLAYAAVMVAVAAWLFGGRELAGNRARES